MENCDNLLYTSRDQMIPNYIPMMKDYCISVMDFVYNEEKDSSNKEWRYQGLEETSFYFNEKEYLPFELFDQEGNIHKIKQDVLDEESKREEILEKNSDSIFSIECQAGTIHILELDYPKKKMNAWLDDENEHVEEEYFYFYDGAGITEGLSNWLDLKYYEKLQKAIYGPFDKYGFYFEPTGSGYYLQEVWCDDQNMFSKTNAIDASNDSTYEWIGEKWKELLKEDEDFKEGEYKGYLEFNYGKVKERDKYSFEYSDVPQSYIYECPFGSDKPFCYLESTKKLEKFVRSKNIDENGTYSRKEKN